MTLNALLDKLATQKGSDLHLVVGQPPVLRVEGQLVRCPEGPILDHLAMESLLFPHLTEAQRTLLEQGQDIEKTLRVEQNRFRFHVFHERGNLAASLRMIPTRVPTLEELGLTHGPYAVFQKLTELKRGLIIVTGPTGSGKSTTVSAMVEEINRQRAERIITIEDPIVFEFESKQSVVSQRTVGEDVPNFPYGLRSAMREDPDVLLIGETRDPETMVLTLTLAETGHLVFSTLHVNTASEAVQRLIEAFPESHQPVIRRLVATNLQAVVAQKLLPRADRPGRVAVHEILLGTPRIRRMIAEGQHDLTVGIEAGRNLGMRTMDDDLVRLAEQGIISHEVAWFCLEDKERLQRKENT